MTRNPGPMIALTLLMAWSGTSAATELPQVPSAAVEVVEPAGAFVAQRRPSTVLFDNGNIDRVYNHPEYAPVFRLGRRTRITAVMTYHWNEANGARPGSIWILDESGRIYGPWYAEGTPGQGGVPNAYWTVYPEITLPAGSYTILDSDPFTWAQNEGSDAEGHARVEGYAR